MLEVRNSHRCYICVAVYVIILALLLCTGMILGPTLFSGAREGSAGSRLSRPSEGPSPGPTGVAGDEPASGTTRPITDNGFQVNLYY